MKFDSCATIGTPLAALTKAQCSTLIEQATRPAFFELTGGSQAAAIGTDTTVLTKSVWDSAVADATSAGARIPQAKFYSPELTSTEGVYVGSNDNSTPGGKTITVGETIPTFTAMFSNLTPVQYAELNRVFSRANATPDFPTLGVVYFCGATQMIIGVDNKAIPITSAFIGSPSGMRLHELTQFPVRWEHFKNWFETVKVVNLGFNHNLL